VIGALLTIAVYFYLYSNSVGVGSAQLVYLHVVIIFATLFFDFSVESKVFLIDNFIK
jgi:hypothetical protein